MDRHDFTALMAELAGSVYDFHERFKAGSFNPKLNGDPGTLITFLEDERIPLLREEWKEVCEADSNFNLMEEMVDVLYVSVGNIESMGDEGERLTTHVIKKNNSKTLKTHYMDEKGKVSKRLVT